MVPTPVDRILALLLSGEIAWPAPDAASPLCAAAMEIVRPTVCGCISVEKSCSFMNVGSENIIPSNLTARNVSRI